MRIGARDDVDEIGLSVVDGAGRIRVSVGYAESLGLLIGRGLIHIAEADNFDLRDSLPAIKMELAEVAGANTEDS